MGGELPGVERPGVLYPWLWAAVLERLRVEARSMVGSLDRDRAEGCARD